MADISQITLPSGTTYDIKDTVARAGIASGGTFIIAWAGTSDPSSAEAKAKIPAGVVVKYGNNAERTGTLEASADTLKKFYLVKATDQSSNQEALDIYDEYVTVDNGENANPRYSWEKIGDTQVKLTAMVTNVTLNKQTSSVIGTDSTFTITQPVFKVTPNTTYIKTSPSQKKLQTTSLYGVKSGNNSTTTASKATAATNQTTVSGLTNSTNNSDLLADCSVSGEVLTIKAKKISTQTTTQFTFSDVTVPIRADEATTVADGTLVATSVTTNVGDTLMTGVSLATDESNATGRVQVATGTQVTASQTTNVGVAWNNKDAQTVLNNSTSLTVSHPN